MSRLSCGPCGEKTQDEIRRKAREEGRDSLTEDEERVLEADDPSEALPTFLGIPAYGPLAPGDVGERCKVCFYFAILFAFAVSGGVFYLTKSLRIGLPLFVGLLLMAGIYGRVLWLGEKIGPYVELLLAKFNIYLTETARRKYRNDQEEKGTVGSQEPVDEPISVETEAVPDSEDEIDIPPSASGAQKELRKVRKERNQYKQLYEEKQDEKREYKKQVEAKEEDIEEIEKEKQEIESKASDLEEQVDELKESIEFKSNFGLSRGPGNQADPGDALACFQPANSESFEMGSDFGGTFLGTWWHMKTVEVYVDHLRESVTVSFGVDNITQVGNMPNDVSEHLEWNEALELEEYLNPTPSELSRPVDFLHPGKTGYDPEKHTVLFWNDLGKVKEARKGVLADVGSEFQVTPIIVAWDTENNYVPPAFDPRAFESVQQLRDRREELNQMLKKKRSQLKNTKRRNENLQHEVQTLEDELEDLRDEIQYRRDRERRALDTSRSLARETEVAQEGRRYLQSERDEIERERDRAIEQTRKARREKLSMSDSAQADQVESEEARKRDKRQIKAVNFIQSVWDTNGHNIDWDLVGDPDYEWSRKDVIDEFKSDQAVSDEDIHIVRNILEPEEVSQ